jgi:antirestriction protein ArdC
MFSPRHCGPTLPDQVEGLPERFHPHATLEVVEPEGRQAELDSFFASVPAVLRHQGDEAYYEPVADRVTMPPAHLFSGFDHYYATLAHELSHNAVTRIMPHGIQSSQDLAVCTLIGSA